MNHMKLRLSLTWSLLIVLVLSGSTVLAQIEDPGLYQGVWYRIAFDGQGNQIKADGHGYEGEWYYYPNSNVYRMWFYNDPYDPDRKGYMRYEAYIKPVDPSESTYMKLGFAWATAEWSEEGHSGPPLPSAVPTPAEESLYISTDSMHIVDNLSNFESIEPVRSRTVYGYNPAWIAIDVIGRNGYVYRGAWHECRAKDPGDPSGNDPDSRILRRLRHGLHNAQEILPRETGLDDHAGA